MNMPAPNPFIPNKTAGDLESFWGRRRDLRLLLSYLLDTERPQSCAIVGPPLIGKTSLLAYLLAAQQTPEVNQPGMASTHTERLERTVQVFIPMSELTTARAERFYQRLFQDMRKRLLAYGAQGKPALNIPSRAPAGELFTALERFRNLLDDAANVGYRFHFLLDDFSAIIENPDAFDDDFFTQLRSCAQLYSVAWVVTSSRPMLDLWNPDDIARAPFFGLLRHLNLGLLPDEEADELLEETARRSNHPFTPDERAALIRLAGPHPAFLQLAGWHFYEARVTRHLSSRPALADATFRYASAANDLYRTLWERLTTPERQTMLTYCSLAGAPDAPVVLPDEEAADLLKTLAQQHALLRPATEGEGYLPFGEGFTDFLHNLPAEAERTEEDDYNDFARLVRQLEVTRDEREHIETSLAQFREGKYEPGLRALFPSLENIAGILIQRRTRRLPPHQLGARLEELHHLSIISQETLDFGLQLVPDRNRAAHGRAINNPQQTARATIRLGRRLLQEASGQD
jgi:hypothetical protein